MIKTRMRRRIHACHMRRRIHTRLKQEKIKRKDKTKLKQN
jgi:hypothetical protein